VSDVNQSIYQTADLALAAYLMLHDFKLVDCGREESGRFRFAFEDPTATAGIKAVEFLSSDCCKFDTHVKNLKKLLYR
jgi:hypothetical protein